MKAGVITFPGSNCDRDLIFALSERVGIPTVNLWHKSNDLQGVDVVFLPGGFSYGDYLRTGAIARFSPIMQAVVAHAAKGGRVVGICNGFQILAEAGLLPGVLRLNVGGMFICDNVYIRPQGQANLLTASLEDRAYKIPIAHAEGNYFCTPDTLKALEDNGQILFRYCNAAGEVGGNANPNGSLADIAGVCNAAGNVFGMMPHPERAADPLVRNTDGLPILQALLEKVAQLA
jgi:phosphoribosylformylglycinamidine synthase